VNLLLLGMSHRTASLELRERFAIEDASAVLVKLCADPDVEEAVLLSTCNRVEVLVWTRQLEAARLRLHSVFERELLSPGAPVARAALESVLYEHTDARAVRQVLRVACSVDSMVVGEPQILGQVKDAYRAAVECGACGPILGRLYQRAFATAKRVRNETRIAERPVSVARVAVDLAQQIFETLEDKSALLVGAGDMIELALQALRNEGLAAVRVANRTRARAAALATRFEATAHGLDELPELLRRSDVVLSCIGGDRPLLGADLVSAAIRDRHGRPIFAIDLGVPRNVHPAVNGIDNAYLYDLDDLTGVAESNAAERRREVERAEAIVAEEQQQFEGWLTALAAVPTIRALRSRAESIRQGELERGLASLSLGDRERQAVEAVTRAIVNKILHAPVSRLRGELEREEGLAHLEAARTLFDLDDAGPVDQAPERSTEGSGDEGPDEDERS
jgi:glutamyl-tRNA reductase